MTARTRACQHGAFIVEFALVLVIFLALLFAALDFGRAMFQASAAVDATRRGARTAAIVDYSARNAGSPANLAVIESMALQVSGLDGSTVTVEYSSTGRVSEDGATFDDGCQGRGKCAFVRVGISYTFPWIAPMLPKMFGGLQLPASSVSTFYTTLPVEALGAT